MKTLPLLRPRARAYGLAVAALALGYGGVHGGGAPLVWAAVGLFGVLAGTAVFAICGFLRDLRRPLSRTLVPAQLQVGMVSVSMLNGKPDRWGPASRFISHLPTSFDHEVVEAGERLLPQARGRVELGPVIRHRSDVFEMFTWRTRALGVNSHLVWPRIDALPQAVLRSVLQQLHALRGTPALSLDDLTLREYQPGDPITRIDWKRSAAHGSMLVRQAEPQNDLRVDLVLTPGSAQATERGVEIMASLAYSLSTQGFSLRVLSADLCIEGELPILLDALAVVPSAHHLPRQAPRGQVVFVLTNPSPSSVSPLLTWLTQAGIDPASAAFFSVVPLPAQTRSLLAGAQVVDL